MNSAILWESPSVLISARSLPYPPRDIAGYSSTNVAGSDTNHNVPGFYSEEYFIGKDILNDEFVG
jgi:hypothetical protein